MITSLWFGEQVKADIQLNTKGTIREVLGDNKQVSIIVKPFLWKGKTIEKIVVRRKPAKYDSSKDRIELLFGRYWYSQESGSDRYNGQPNQIDRYREHWFDWEDEEALDMEVEVVHIRVWVNKDGVEIVSPKGWYW